MCLFFLPAELGKTEGVHGGHVAALEHAGQRSMTCSACFLQLDLSALINDALTCAIPACINRVFFSELPAGQHVCRSSIGSPTGSLRRREQIGPPSLCKRSSCWVGQLHICLGWMDISPSPHRSKNGGKHLPRVTSFLFLGHVGKNSDLFFFLSQRPSAFISKGQVKSCLAI